MAKNGKTPYTNKANQYARDVVAGKYTVSWQIKAACQRHLDDLEKAKDPSFPYKFSPQKSERALNFAHKMIHTKGKWAGTPIVLEPWQCFIVAATFGWIQKADGLRRFREIYCQIPRKNGKSLLAAVIGNYMLTADGEHGAEIYSGATTEKQALEVFRPAWLMTVKNEQYKKFYGLNVSGTHVNPTTIYSISTNSRFELIVGNPGDGSSPHCSIIDEYHEHKTARQYDAMKTGQGAREQPLICIFTTAGTNTSYPCFDKKVQCEEILRGKVVNDRIFAMIYTIDDDDDWTLFENWIKANPNYGISVFHDFLHQQYQDCMQIASKQNILQCKHLNRWCNAGTAFVNMYEWEKCRDKSLRIDAFDGERCWVGVDLASKIDIAAVVAVFRRKTDYYLFPFLFIPEEQANKAENTHYQGWVHDGYLITTPGNMIDLEAISECVKDLARRFKVVKIPHDPWGAAAFVSDMMKNGLPMLEIPQNAKYLSEPMKEFEAKVLSNQIHHQGNECFDWMVSNVVAKMDFNDNVFPRKEHVSKKIDGFVAAIMALGEAIVDEPKIVRMPIIA